MLRPVVAAAFVCLVCAHRGVAQCSDGSQPPCAPSRPAVRVDTQAVVVLPFAVRGPAESQYLGEAMADLFQVGLDGLGGYRLMHPSAVKRRLGDVTRPADVGEAAPVVRALGARYALGGSVVVAGGNLRINAELYDAVRGRRVLPLLTQGTADRLDAVVDSLVVTVVVRGPLKNVGGAPNSGEFTTRSPGAMRAYLAGEQLARSGAWRDAADSLQSSIRQDSAFGWAWRSLQRIISNAKIPAIPGLNAAEARHRSRFTERLQRYGAVDWRVNRAAALTIVDQLAARYPYDPDIAYLQGDVYYHVARELGKSQADVRTRIERALALDGDRPETIGHYAPLLAEIGDTAGALTAIARARIQAPNDLETLGWEMAMRALFRGEDPLALQRERPTNADYLTLRLVPRDPARAIVIADSFARVLSAGVEGIDRQQYYIRRYHYALGQGRYAAAAALLDTALARAPELAARPRTFIHAIVTGARREEAAALYRTLLPRIETLSLPWTSALAWYAVQFEPVDSAEKTITVFDRRPNEAIAPAIGMGLRGLLALRRGDTAAARELLAKAHQTHTRQPGLPSQLFPSISFALTLARLDLATGNARSARHFLSDAYPPHEVVQHMPFAEELLGQVSEALGDFAAAREAYGNVVKLLANADPALVPMRTAAQAALQRLSTRP